MNEFIDHLYKPLRITSNYKAIADVDNSEITIAPAKPFFPQSAMPSHAVPWQRLLTVKILQFPAHIYLHGLPCRIKSLS
jgi:hypothetical protein